MRYRPDPDWPFWIRPSQEAYALVLSDDDDAVSRDGEAGPICLQIQADGGAFGDHHALVEDRVPDDGARADPDAIQEHRALDERAPLDADLGRQDGAVHRSAGHDHAGTDHRVECLARL